MKDELEIGIIDGDGVIVYKGKITPGKGNLIKLAKGVEKKYS